ncbi:MAG: PEP-CTERM sorting domain-containing protein [Anaerohalosphaera sp.]|nr:PEP-CTERM sorting domain-containing protein [Anaerohalosphaera sp.]
MKRLVTVLAVCAMAATSIAGLSTDIDFSTDDGGSWQYDGVGTFSFLQPVGIDRVQNGAVDALEGQFVFIPNMTLSNEVISGGLVKADITPGTLISIKDAGGNVILEGTLGDGDFFAYNTISGAYSEFMTDIIVTSINYTIGSNLLDTIRVGTELDFNLTLQHRSNFADIIGQGIEASGTLSGSMSIVPEPATMVLLAIGGLLARRRK